MEDISDLIQKFFEDYEARFAEGLAGGDVTEGTITAFAPDFVEASPEGIIGGKNDESFRQAIPKGYEFYRSVGVTKMEIQQVDITTLDDMHYMVDVSWESFYSKDGRSGSIEFNVIYMLQYRDEQLRIFAYITGDEQGALKDHGLI